jgi:hypothetical protein
MNSSGNCYLFFHFICILFPVLLASMKSKCFVSNFWFDKVVVHWQLYIDLVHGLIYNTIRLAWQSIIYVCSLCINRFGLLNLWGPAPLKCESVIVVLCWGPAPLKCQSVTVKQQSLTHTSEVLDLSIKQQSLTHTSGVLDLRIKQQSLTHTSGWTSA